MNRYTAILLLLASFSCKKTEKEPDYIIESSRVRTEIENMIIPKACVTKVEDCRFKSILCGSVFVYNAAEVDSVRLFSLFSQLQNLIDTAPINNYGCDIIAPNSTLIADCKCIAVYKN